MANIQFTELAFICKLPYKKEFFLYQTFEQA